MMRKMIRDGLKEEMKLKPTSAINMCPVYKLKIFKQADKKYLKNIYSQCT